MQPRILPQSLDRWQIRRLGAQAEAPLQKTTNTEYLYQIYLSAEKLYYD
jgi:hypothetical protein